MEGSNYTEPQRKCENDVCISTGVRVFKGLMKVKILRGFFCLFVFLALVLFCFVLGTRNQTQDLVLAREPFATELYPCSMSRFIEFCSLNQ